jgi:pimeloyl-ACP methyl ester carboxylesterase
MQKDWKQATITIDNGIEIFYTRTGGEKPKIVLAHGITDSGLCWHQLASDLEVNYDLIMYDAYGHGKSSRVDQAKRFDLVEDLHDLIQALDLGKPAIFGHSMGAGTAAAFAAKFPDKLSALVLEDPPWSEVQPDSKTRKTMLQQWKKRNAEAQQKTVKDLIKLKKKESPKWEEAILSEWAQAKLDFDLSLMDQLPEKVGDWREQAKSIKVPTLIITGDNELGAIVTPKLGVEAIELLEKGEFGHISAAGHCVRYEQYQPYLTMVKLFLKRNLPA